MPPQLLGDPAMTESSMHKDELRRIAARRKRRNAFFAKVAIAAAGASALAAWALLVAR